MADVLIPGLMIGACEDHLCVRASRFWDFFDPSDESKLLHSDLVLIDEEGNSIHAQIYTPAHERFKLFIKEGCVYNFSCFKVRKSNNSYKPVTNNVMLSFSRWTEVEEVVEVPPAFPVFTYSLTPIEEAPARLDYTIFFTDVIGIVTSVSNVWTLWSKCGQTHRLKRVITIRSASNASINVVLWGERVTSYPGEQVHVDGQASPQVVIFAGTLVRSYLSVIFITGGSSCKWYINLDVPKANALVASRSRLVLSKLLKNRTSSNPSRK